MGEKISAVKEEAKAKDKIAIKFVAPAPEKNKECTAGEGKCIIVNKDEKFFGNAALDKTLSAPVKNVGTIAKENNPNAVPARAINAIGGLEAVTADNNKMSLDELKAAKSVPNMVGLGTIITKGEGAPGMGTGGVLTGKLLNSSTNMTSEAKTPSVTTFAKNNENLKDEQINEGDIS